MKLSRSLFARLTMAQFLLLLVFQVLGMAIANHFIIQPLVRSSTQDLSGLLSLSAQTWSQLEPAQRSLFITQLQRSEGIVLRSSVTPLVSAPGLLPYGRELQNTLRQRYGPDANVRFEEYPESMFWVDIPLPQTRLQFAFPQSRIGTSPYLAVLLTFGSSALLGLLAAIYLARRLTRPLRDISAAAQQVGAGLQPRLADTHGVAELDTLTQNFNRMVEEIHALLNNRTTLLAGVSHDLRSPMTRMRMALELARAQLSETQFVALERYLEQMNQLITEYLDFAQGCAQRAPQPLALAGFITQLCAETQDNTLDNACADSKLIVLADPLSLQRVLGNLLDNARRYAQPPIRIEAQRVGQQVTIRISDHGPGIPAEQRERVFEPFVRLESSRNSQTGGSGLGLAIVREICRSHGWQVRLEENAAHGLTACLILPSA